MESDKKNPRDESPKDDCSSSLPMIERAGLVVSGPEITAIIWKSRTIGKCMPAKGYKNSRFVQRQKKQKTIDNGRIRTYACEHNAYDVSEEIAGHRLNHSATLSYDWLKFGPQISDYVARHFAMIAAGKCLTQYKTHKTPGHDTSPLIATPT